MPSVFELESTVVDRQSNPLILGMNEGVSEEISEQRVTRVWCEWLQTLAHDPEAALAAAQAYQQLGDEDREQWLNVLESDAGAVGVPSIAIYAPLLAVESEPRRYRRILDGIHYERGLSEQLAERKALFGQLPNGAHVAVLIEPLYLDFVQVVACAYHPGRHFTWVKLDPLVTAARALQAGSVLEGALLESVPSRSLVDELARTVVAHGRSGREFPEGLCALADLFGPDGGPSFGEPWPSGAD